MQTSEPSAPTGLHIVHVLTRLLPAGTEENTIAIARRQAADGHRVSFVHGRQFSASLRGALSADFEVFSIAIRPFTLSVRLFGNVFGGENLLHGTGFIFVFYFMELLVGVIQALVFTLLTSVYIGLLCNHEGGDHAHGEHGDDHEEAHGEAAHGTHH